MNERNLLRDRYGTIIGQIAIEGVRQTLRDRYGYLLGWYDSTSNFTRDKYGNVIGKGNLLVTLLK
jgi:hypothetical protein